MWNLLDMLTGVHFTQDKTIFSLNHWDAFVEDNPATLLELAAHSDEFYLIFRFVQPWNNTLTGDGRFVDVKDWDQLLTRLSELEYVD
jgi:hypothetical protein